MKAIKHEFKRIAPFRARASRTPSLLKEALEEHSESHILYLNAGSNSASRQTKRYYSTAPQICTCSKTSQLGLWRFGLGAYVTLRHPKMHVKDCPAHTSTKRYSAAIRCYVQTTILENLLKLSFEATYGAGGLSMGFLLRTFRRIQTHPLKSFFHDLYRQERHRHGHRSSKPSYNNKTRDALLRLTQRELLHAFNTGIASPNDVDCKGRTLLHVTLFYLYLLDATNNGQLQVEYANNCHGIKDPQLAAQIIRLLISMGAKTDCLDGFG
jgi:hypothetical protein